MKKFTLLLVFISMIMYSNITLNAQDVQIKDSIAGIWANQVIDNQGNVLENDSVEVVVIGDVIFVKLYKLERPVIGNCELRTDIKNPKDKLKERPLQGLIIFKDCKVYKDSLSFAECYDYSEGKTTKGRIEFENSNDRNRLKVTTGDKTTHWTKKKNN